MSTTLPQRIVDLLEQEFGAPTPGWAQQELHAAVAKLIGRVGELCALRELQTRQQRGHERG